VYELTKVVVGPFEVDFVLDVDLLLVLLFEEDLLEDVLLAFVEEVVELLEEDLLEVEETEVDFEDDLVLLVDVDLTLELVDVLLLDWEDVEVFWLDDELLVVETAVHRPVTEGTASTPDPIGITFVPQSALWAM
jgi:hypothetical protein